MISQQQNVMFRKKQLRRFSQCDCTVTVASLLLTKVRPGFKSMSQEITQIKENH